VKFVETSLAGVLLVRLEPVSDARGWFARSFCVDEFGARGLDPSVAQSSVSFNERAGTLRGMHWQAPPAAEAKLVRCTRGAIYDVALDLRADSSTRGHWFAAELTPDNHTTLFVPEGVAHGFQTLQDATELTYLISREYDPAAARGVRFDDPAFGIEWPPADTRIVSERDLSYPDFGT
jgi:dTDP-4-dehydrorhamnose 3,5-epimerase